MPKLFHTLCCCIRPNSYKKSDGGECENGAAPASSIITQVNKGQEPPTVPGQQLPSTKQRHNAAVAVAGGKQPATTKFLENKNYSRFLLPRPHTHDHHKKCLIIDLDETLVHSSFKPVKNADFIIPVEIDNVVHQVYVLKRPYTDEFLERVGALFECVLFTASLSKYADPVADLLDKKGIFRSRLFREACVFFEGNYVKDLGRLGRELNQVLIIDNSPASYAFHPDNAIPVRTWFDDPHDCELLELMPLLEKLAHPDKDIYSVLGTCPPAVRQAPAVNTLQNNNNNNNKFVSNVPVSTTTIITSTTNPPTATTNRRSQQAATAIVNS